MRQDNSTTNIVIVSNRPGQNTFGERLETQESLRDDNQPAQHPSHLPRKSGNASEVQEKYRSFISGETQMKYPGAATSALLNQSMLSNRH